LAQQFLEHILAFKEVESKLKFLEKMFKTA